MAADKCVNKTHDKLTPDNRHSMSSWEKQAPLTQTHQALVRDALASAGHWSSLSLSPFIHDTGDIVVILQNLFIKMVQEEAECGPEMRQHAERRSVPCLSMRSMAGLLDGLLMPLFLNVLVSYGGSNPVPFLQSLSGCGRLWSPLAVKGETVHIG